MPGTFELPRGHSRARPCRPSRPCHPLPWSLRRCRIQPSEPRTRGSTPSYGYQSCGRVAVSPHLPTGVCKVPYYQVCWGRISSCVKGKGNIMAELWGRIWHVQRERGSNIIFPVTVRLLGRILSRKKGTENLGKKIKMKKNEMGKNIKL